MKKGNINTIILADLQDLNERHFVTLDGAKEFLSNLWEDLEENDPYFQRIEEADYDTLDDMLMGCDYTLFRNLEELEEYSQL